MVERTSCDRDIRVGYTQTALHILNPYHISWQRCTGCLFPGADAVACESRYQRKMIQCARQLVKRFRFVLNAPAAVNGLRRTVAFYAFHSHVDLDQSVEKSQSIFIRAMCAHKLPASKWSRHWCFKHLHIDYKYQTCDADLHPNYQLQTRTRRKTVPNSTNNNNYVIQNNANTFIYSTQAT